MFLRPVLLRVFLASLLCAPGTLPAAANPIGTVARVGVQPTKIRAHAQTVLINENFTQPASTPNAWRFGGSACLTAGNATTPPTSIPACGSQAPLDPPGSGVLDLTQPADYTQGFAIWSTPLATSAGLVATFNYFSYDSSNITGDGLALIFADASINAPGLGGCCGSLDYAPASSTPFQPGLANGYLAVGIDENGFWTCACYGKIGGPGYAVPNIISVRGAAAVNWTYLTSSSFNGKPAQLPFPLSAGRSTVRPGPLTFTITLTSTGVLSVAIDRHDGHGSNIYLPPTQIAGLYRQPAVPTNVYLGFTSSQGASNARHEINDVLVTTTY